MNIYAVIPLVAAAVYGFLFASMLAHRPWPRRHAYFAVFLLTGILWSVSDVLFRSNFLMDHKLLLARATVIGFVLTLVPLAHYVETYHRGLYKVSSLSLGYFSLASTTTAAILGYVPERLVLENGVAHSYTRPLLLIGLIGVPFLILGVRGVYCLWRRLKNVENPAMHNQIMYLIISIVILGMAALSNLPAFGRQVPVAHSGSLAVACIFAYATLKGQLIDYKLVARTGLVFAGLTAVLAVTYLVVLYLVRQWFGFELSLLTVALTTGIGLGMAVLSYPVRDMLDRKVVDKILYPRTHDYRRILVDFSARAGTIIKIDELREETTKHVTAALRAKRAYLMVPETDTAGNGYAFTAADSGNGYGWMIEIGHDSPIAEWLLRERKPLFEESLHVLPEFSHLRAEEINVIHGAEIELFAPLISRDKLVGILALSGKEPPGPYDMSDIELVDMVTHRIALAIENAEVHARIEKLAITDMMTGVFNRRYFDERVTEEVNRHLRYGGNFSLVLFDLDRFKHYNDAYGHRVGDELLKQVAQAARESVRNIDLVFRYGGDEFALLLPGTSAQDAGVVCERVQSRMATRMQVQGTGITLSMGISALPEDGRGFTELVRAADDALYYCKRSGGNRVCRFSEIQVNSSADGSGLGDGKGSLAAAHALIAAAEAKDSYIAAHSRLVAVYAAALARAAALPAEQVTIVEIAALLHDIGKIGIPDEVLSKKERLTPDDWQVMKRYSQLAATIIGPVAGLAPCLPIIAHNHESYDGVGYPNGLKGKEIPLEARILAIADAFATMISNRPYHPAVSGAEAIEELRRCSGAQFDPELVEIFIPIAQTLAIKK